jgi:hypothetical protein
MKYKYLWLQALLCDASEVWKNDEVENNNFPAFLLHELRPKSFDREQARCSQ